MANYEEARVKLTNAQLNKLKSAAKEDWTTLRITKKRCQDEELSHELLLTTRQKSKIKNDFVNNMSTDIKLSKAQFSEIIQSAKLLGSLLGKLAGPLIKCGVLLAKKFLTPLVTMASASALDGSILRKMRVRGVAKAGKGITLVISNEDIDDIIKIIKSLENSGVLINGVTEIKKHKSKKQQGGFLGMLLGT